MTIEDPRKGNEDPREGNEDPREGNEDPREGTTWQNLGLIAWGGSVLSIHTNLAGQTWAATSGGLLARGQDGSLTTTGWRPVPGGPAQPGYVTAPAVNWWAAGLNGGLSSTVNSGRTWWDAWVDQVDEPITCMAFSPRWTSDRVMLAGTAGAGVLRSIDGGRRWLLSNFGLQDYTVLALAPATDWSRREVIFAGTVDGAYRSSGGGRAWKPAGLAGLPVQALAASAGYAENGVVLAGTEGAGLVRTTDGGESWQPVGDALGRDISVNALLRVADGEGEAWLAATDAGDLWRSVDAGVTWARVYENGEPVLALSVSPDGATLWAGTSEHGALVSRDLGCTWAPDTQLCGWGFRRLLNPGGEAVLAWAPTGGVWRSEDGGRGWERIVASSHYEPVFAYLPVADGALEARTEGLWLRQEEEDQPALDTGDAPVVALAADRAAAVIWAADAAGGLASSRDGGGSWQVVAVPWAGQQLLSLAAAPEDGTPLVATHDANSGSITVWRLTDGGWEGWLERPAKWAGAALAPAGTNGEETWAVIAGEVWAHRGSAGWREETLPAEAGAAVGLAQRGDVHCLIAGRAVLVQDADGEWETLSLPEAAAAPVDVVVRPDDGLLLLDAAGTLWLAER